MRNAYFCTTPYQVLTSIVLNRQLNRIADIYVIDQFPGADAIVQTLRRSGLFEEVVFIQEYSVFNIQRRGAKASRKRIKYIDIYLKLDTIVEHICPDMAKYSDLFVSCNGFIPRLFILYSVKHGLKMKYHYYDDGIGSYYNDKIYTLSRYDYWARKILVGRKTTDIQYDIYLYQPEMFKELLPEIAIDCNEIRAMERNDENMCLIDKIYGIHEYEEVSEKVVFMDTVHSAITFSMGNDAMMKEINNLVKLVGQDDFLIKPHPRDTKKWYDCNYYKNSSFPMEVLCIHQDFTDKILITFFSTAVFTPKMLYGQEPTIILMYKAFGSTVNINHKDDLCKSIVSTYNDKSKVIVPESLEELTVALNNIMKKGNGNHA